MTPQPRDDFNATLVRSIDESIAGLLGRSVVPALHAHLRQFYDMTPDEIPYRLETFGDLLRKMFGLNFEVVERSIAKQFYSHLVLPFERKEGYSLIDYIEEAKRRV